MNTADRLLSVWKESRCVLVFSGAGISTGSGIPDFRGLDGLWQKWKPVYYADFLRSHDSRVEHWKFKLAGWDAFRSARPNPAHLALADLQREKRIQAIVTQNIDGLHQAAAGWGDTIIELHGTNREVECVNCGKRSQPGPHYEAFRKTGEPPICSRCQGFLKPATISFGQGMPEESLGQAFALAESCDLAVSIGSTLSVEPAASVPLTAKKRGAFYAILNRGPTSHDSFADLVWDTDLTKSLPLIASRLLAEPQRL